MSDAGSSSTPSGEAEAPKRIPKGVVLGKDGKPCRSCTSFAAWANQTKSSLKSGTGVAAGGLAAAAGASSATAASAASAAPADCPPDVETLGRSTWTLLHAIAGQYPTQPTPAQQSDVKGFIGSLSRLYPCWVCAEDFQVFLAQSPVRAASRDEFGRWLCAAHNEVNEKLGKPQFDCNLWEERWRTGWKDGRCD